MSDRHWQRGAARADEERSNRCLLWGRAALREDDETTFSTPLQSQRGLLTGEQRREGGRRSPEGPGAGGSARSATVRRQGRGAQHAEIRPAVSVPKQERTTVRIGEDLKPFPDPVHANGVHEQRSRDAVPFQYTSARLQRGLGDRSN